MAQHGFGRLRADKGCQFFAAGTSDPRDGSKRRQQLLAPAWPDAWNVVERGTQVAHPARSPMKREGETVRLVANPLNQEQRRVLARQGDAIRAVAREQQLL